MAPLAIIRLTGDGDAGRALLRPLFGFFASGRGWSLDLGDGPAFRATIRDSATAPTLAEIDFVAADPPDALAALRAGRADLVIALEGREDCGARVLALKVLVAVMASRNRLPHLSTADLARALQGEIDNWREIGGPDMPPVLHALKEGTGLQQALGLRLEQSLGPAARMARWRHWQRPLRATPTHWPSRDDRRRGRHGRCR